MKRFLPIFYLLFSSCSAIMAFTQKGVPAESIQKAVTREDLLALGAKPIASEANDAGGSVETFQIAKKRPDSIGRGLVYTMMDLTTFCLWEFFGTPIEAALQEKETCSIQVTFDADQRVQRLEVL